MIDQRPAGPEVRVLLMAPNWLGDTVMFAALLSFLDQNWALPDGRHLVLEMAVRSAWAPLFQQDTRLAHLLDVKRTGRHAGVLGGWRMGEEFRSRNPQAVVLGPPSFRAGLAAWRSGASLRVAYHGDGRRALINHGRATPPRGQIHHSLEFVQLGCDLLAALGHPGEFPSHGDYLPVLPGCDHIRAASFHSSTPLWVLAPGATYGSAKSWPLARSLEFAREAIDHHRVSLVLLGDAAATGFVDELARGLGCDKMTEFDGTPGLVDLTGRTDLNQVVSLLKSSRVFVGNDSGLMHLAAALGVPTVGIFGSSNPDWTSPKGPLTRVVAADGFDCRPCYLKTCNQKEFCLDTISADRVLAAVDELLIEGK